MTPEPQVRGVSVVGMVWKLSDEDEGEDDCGGEWGGDGVE